VKKVDKSINAQIEEMLAIHAFRTLKTICCRYVESCPMYDNGDNTQCPLLAHCDEEYGIRFPCNLNIGRKGEENG